MIQKGVMKRRGALARIERVGNALPDPTFIFLILIVVLMLVSAFSAGWSAINPSTGQLIKVESLLSVANLRRLLVDTPKTLTSFPALGLVLVVMMGAAVAERSGLFTALIGRMVKNLPVTLLTPATYFIGLLSHQAADAAYVVLIPLAAIVYAGSGRHPLAGIAVAYAGISGAFAGNLLPGQFDVLILGITQAAAQLLVPNYPLNPLGNWWFTATLGLVLLPVVWAIADRVVEPRLGKWREDGDAAGIVAEPEETLSAQRRGLRRSGLAALGVVGLFVGFLLAGVLTDENAVGAARMAPFYESLIAGFFLLFLAVGWTYGRAVGSISTHRDVVRMMGEGLRDLAPYIVIVFFAAHFVAMFGWSKLGPVMAIHGAEGLRGLNLPLPLMLIALLLLSSVFDLLIGSASAKWSVMAPIVVPLLMLLGVSPEMTTAAYRMGDSIFNIVTPVASNFVLVMVICQRWSKGFGVGSLIAMMLPFSIAIAVTGMLLVSAWVTLVPTTGPDAPVAYVLPANR